MKNYHHLTQQQRYTIQDLFELGKTHKFIANEVGVDRSTISREISRHRNGRGGYKAKGAHAHAVGARTSIFDYPRKIKGLLEQVIIEKLLFGWSPEQISGRLKLENSDWSISHESIYNWIYKTNPQYKKILRREGKRQRRGNTRKRRWVGKEPRKSITERPVACAERAETGHWERDLVEGIRGHSALLVIVDRKSKLTVLEKVDSHYAEHVNEKTNNGLALRQLNVDSMTNDNGIEFGQQADLEIKLKAPVFFCHPYSSWERGTVENTNGLIRQVFPKKTNFDKVTNDELQQVENMLNFRPRKTLNYETPHEFHYEEKTKLINSKNYYRKKRNQRIDKEFHESLARAWCALTP